MSFVVDLFGNILYDIIILIFLLIGVIIGMLFRPRWGNAVLKLIPREHRFVEFGVEEETAVSIECGNVKGHPPHRFIKYAPGFTGVSGRILKKPRTVFLGKEGTAYTWKTEQGKETKIGTIADALKTIVGKKFYEVIPDEQRELIEQSKINVSVDLDDGLTPEGFKTVTEEDIKTEEDRRAAETYWKGKELADQGTIWKWIPWFIAGMGVMAIVSKLFGWW